MSEQQSSADSAHVEDLDYWREEARDIRAINEELRAEIERLSTLPQTAPELTATCQKLLPGGIIDDATYAEIEDALDRADAPATVGGRWLKLHERIAALTAERPAASAEPQSQAESE